MVDMVDGEDIALRLTDFPPKLREILRKAVQALGGSGGLVSLWDDSKASFTYSASFGLTSETLEELRPLLEQVSVNLLAKQATANPRPLFIRKVGYPFSPLGRWEESILTLPLKVDDKIIGLMYILRLPGREGLLLRDRRILEAFADHAAIAIENARLAYELAEEKGKIESIIHYSADGIMTIDKNRRIVEFNQAMEKLTGWTKDEVLYKPCSEVMRLCDNNESPICETNCPIVKSMLRAESVFELEGTIITKDNQRPYVAMTYSIVRSRDNQPMLAVVNCRDISRLRELENLRSTFLSIITHELQTPIAIIKSYADTMRRDDVSWDNDTILESFATIEEESDRLSKLVNNLLYASRIEAGGLEMRRNPVHLPTVARRVTHRLEPKLDGRRVELDFSKDFPSILADEERIESVFSNLLDNSIKYSQDKGAIVISGRVRGDKAIVSIQDEGIGIPVREIDKVFDRFHRVDNSLTRHSQGAGLGLYICRSIIKAHGGDIWVESKAGEGSHFNFVLPLELAEDEHYE